MSQFGVISPFNLRQGDFAEYLERLEQYFVANDVPAEKETVILITVIGEESYSLLRTLLAPAKPHTMGYAALSKVLVDHLGPKPIVIAERFKFYNRNQHIDESITDFLAE